MAKKILIIEDSAIAVSLLKARIEASGFETVAAADGTEGLAKIKSEKPDLVILDVRMPGMDGFEVCRLAKSDPQTKGIPILFVTAVNQQKDIQRGKEAGGDGYITKPYDGKVLITEINKFLK